MVITWFFSALIGTFFGLYLGFFYPSGINSLNQDGFHIGGFQVTTFGFNFESLKIDYAQSENAVTQFIVYNINTNRLNPKLTIKGEHPSIEIRCIEQESRRKCEDGFTISDQVIIEFNVTTNYPARKPYNLHFWVGEGNNYYEDDLTIFVN